MPVRRDFNDSPSSLSTPVEALSPGVAGRCSRLRPGASCLLLGAAVLSLAACGGNDPDFTTLFTTEHFVYHVEAGTTPPCDGTDQWLERYYRANAAFLGATLPAGERIDYYRTGSEESLGCAPEASGCTIGTTIYSILSVHPHEIVHANAGILGEPPALFQEGLANVLGCTTTTDFSGPLDLSDPIEQLVETDAFTGWSHCEVLDLDPAQAAPARSKQIFAPGAVLHLGAPAAPFKEHFTVRLRVAPEQEPNARG